MRIIPSWIRDFVTVADSNQKMADDLTASGVAIEGFYGSGDDLVYEAEVTTNRVDAMNHYGVAREVSAIYDVDLKPVAPKLPAAQKFDFPIEIEDAQGCARYTARVVRNVKIAPSPAHIAHRLELLESRPINNVADATNYSLNELGHPTHAFDLDLLEGGKIVVRRARPGETITTLDGVERKLAPEDLVIADAVKPVAIAGVMGGSDSMITDKTKNVLIESAWFDPAAIRRTSKRLGMHTDASHRFERGADYGITPTACARVAELILATAGGELGEEIDAVARKVERPKLELTRHDVRRILGTDISEQEIARILRRLGFGVTLGRLGALSGSTAVPGSSAATAGRGGLHVAVAESVADFVVQVPTWRLDVERPIDLIEELARIYGYNKFANTLPSFAGAVVELPTAHKQALVRSRLMALGYDESMSSTFMAHDDAKIFGGGEPVQIANPLNDEMGYMRTSLVPGMLNQVAYNLNRGNNNVRLFESGDVFEMVGESVNERRRVTLVATGAATEGGVHGKSEPYSVFSLKGDIERLLEEFSGAVIFDTQTPTYLHPGRSARATMNGATVAIFGQLHPEVSERRKLKQEVFVAELFVDRLFERELREPQYKPISRYPAVDRDFSFVFDDAIGFDRIRTAVESLKIPEMKSLVPVEIFRGGNVPGGSYSALLRAEFQSAGRTLRDEEVALWSQQIIKALEALGGVQRA